MRTLLDDLPMAPALHGPRGDQVDQRLYLNLRNIDQPFPQRRGTR